MDTVSYSYARRRKHVTSYNPWKQRWVLRGTVYVPTNHLSGYVFGVHKDHGPVVILGIARDGETRGHICMSEDGDGWFIGDAFTETERTDEHFSCYQELEAFLEYHQRNYSSSHNFISLEDAESLFL